MSVREVKYRPEIDGLRALAVGLVVFYHSGFVGFSGGFIGVDVFFVISGYLITSLILAELDGPGFSYWNFYERRARRILPALLIVLTVSIPFAWFLLTPSNLKDFSQSIVATIGFSSNFLFWKESGYFDTDAALKPLLHTWSLAVEEQFYLIFPPLLMLAWRYGKRHFELIVVAGFILSIALAQYTSVYYPTAGFFLLPSRGWELLAGAYLAHRERIFPIHLSGRLAGALADTGIVLVVVGTLLFDSSTPHPSVLTALPVLGAGLFIAFGREKSVANYILTRRPVILIGLLSYSLYLWHVPVFVFFSHYMLEEADSLQMVGLCLLSLALAFVTWKYVEAPFRNRRKMSARSMAVGLLSLSVVPMAFGLSGHFSGGFPLRLSMPTALKRSFARLPEPACFDSDGISKRPSDFCVYGHGTGKIDLMLFGDSHAYSVLPAFIEAARRQEKGFVFVSYSSCLPFLGLTRDQARERTQSCRALNDAVFNYVREKKIGRIALAAYWGGYTDGGVDRANTYHLQMREGDPTGKKENREAFLYGLKKTIRAYEKIDVKVFLIGDAPAQHFYARDVYQRIYFGSERSPKDAERALQQFSVSETDHLDLTKFSRDAFERYRDRADLVNLDSFFCSNQFCRIGTPRQSYYYDRHHLSIVGAEHVAEAIEPLFETK
ncbi:acyltransferase family protein [Parvibaculum sp.]|uniref:acyltransferase family protein n=1 Tax=Parvibaculum sp. TaxID=2024848 RepID=UPI0025D72107|nr:acyltransferase family protein [Parvibaculum sp.]